MNKTVLLVLTIIFASMTGGCSFLGNAKKDFDESANQPIPKVKSAPTPTETAKTEEEGEEEFADLEEETEATQAIAGLIPTTNADTRVRNIVRGRQDPFSVVSLIPKIEIEEKEEKAALPALNRSDRTNREPNPVAQTRSENKSPTPIDEFRTKLAQEVIISGLYESNGSTKLIVQAPEENNSRYVEVGQYLSNGQILVKSIDRNHFPTPLVILEQSGVEVAKAIGETPEDSKNQASLLPTSNLDHQALVSNISLDTE
ncbi:hypothetical protein I4641_21145 [Waterburya agarophytonicola K14]|uniref:Uncharacterized protein n=1 Tax=Waterburya agarophytonicola KI4 TaxID=2874699 RepID=A0A964FGZ3_9CYAN|nr:hypothetical protein [Waterburya agarophytonicola]MCC0179470.1 hypothetical protein [Waterburya agarophytonicola KI4]